MDALAIHEAYKRGELEALKLLLGNPPDFPNCRGPRGMGEIILEYAIHHNPLPFIQQLLELGANANYMDHAGFPSLIGRCRRIDRINLNSSNSSCLMMSASSKSATMATHRSNWAAADDDPAMFVLLFKHGADPTAKTTVDDYTTPLEEAENFGREKAAAALRMLTGK